MSTKEIIKYLKTTISEKGEYCYSLSKQTTKAIIKHIDKQEEEIERLNNIINELEKEIDRLLERQYASERFAEENGFCTYLPAKENLLCVKNKLQELKENK